ncbi:MAG: phosphoribosyltransferase family protein [Candidatus Taylorbacteria bacterium]|nr:phosphoribosyltransferase family protein [Candidatus Taylorbacteria bacterium]
MCKKCLKKLPVKENFECIGCKASTPLGKTCINCRDTESVDQLLIVSDYKNPAIVKIIKLLKYRFVTEAIKPISIMMKRYIYRMTKYKKLNILEEEPVITFVPLRHDRLNWRGFNQAELIAKALADIVQQAVRSDVILRIKSSKPQAEIKEREERLKKPRGVFGVIDGAGIAGKTIILVDDVCTTGATLNECARILKEAGAKKVIGFVIARG